MSLDAQLPALAQDPVARDILVFLHQEQPDGAEYHVLKDAVFLPDTFDAITLRQWVTDGILLHTQGLYRLTDDARTWLTQHPDALQ